MPVFGALHAAVSDEFVADINNGFSTRLAGISWVRDGRRSYNKTPLNFTTSLDNVLGTGTVAAKVLRV